MAAETGERYLTSSPSGELERAEALSNFNRTRRRVRREGCLPEGQASRFATGKAKSKISVCRRGDFCGGKSHFPEQKSFPCGFYARKSERFQQNLVGVVGRLKTQRVFRFCHWQNCHGSNRRFEARHLAGELAPPSTSLSKFFDKLSGKRLRFPLSFAKNRQNPTDMDKFVSFLHSP